MSDVIVVDTTIFMNVLNVPGFNQDYDDALSELTRLNADVSTSLILPIATIIETGNHIAHLPDGRLRVCPESTL